MGLTWSQRVVLGQLEELSRVERTTAWICADEIAARFPPADITEMASNQARRVAAIESELLQAERLGFVRRVDAAVPAFQLTKKGIGALIPTARVCARLKSEALERRLRAANLAMEQAVPASPDLIRLYHAYLKEWFGRGNTGDPLIQH